MPTKSVEQILIEEKYRFRIKALMLLTLFLIVFLDALLPHFDASIQLELALVAALAGVEVRERVKKEKQIKRLIKKRVARKK